MNGNDDWEVIPHQRATFAALDFREWLGQRRRKNKYKQHDQEDARTLHVYLSFSLLPGNVMNNNNIMEKPILLGWSSFPSAQTTGDGVYLRYDVITGGGRHEQHWDAGYWLVHEVGHWLGLLHTFKNGCNEPGDWIDDTGYEATPAFGCPAGRNTCSDSLLDPIYNFMDYTGTMKV